MVANTLEIIRDKVRKVTARPSPNQIRTDQIDFYINTFYLYDFPEHYRLKTLETNFTFVTEPNIEIYDFPVEQFISLEPPSYVAGYRIGFYQDQSAFYSVWPKNNFFQNVGTGDGTINPSLSNLTKVPVLRKSITISTLISSNSISYLDNGNGSFVEEGVEITSITNANPGVVTVINNTFVNGDKIIIENVSGMTELNGNNYTVANISGNQFELSGINTTLFTPYTGNGISSRVAGTINYITGAIAMDWGNIPDLNADITVSYIPYVASRPRDMLFFDNKILFRPIPDKAYKVEIVAYQQPIELLASNQIPELAHWWQLIALGAAVKIFEDSGEMDLYQQYRPLLDEQMLLANRRTVKQNTKRQISTPFKQNNQSAEFGIFYDIFGG